MLFIQAPTQQLVDLIILHSQRATLKMSSEKGGSSKKSLGSGSSANDDKDKTTGGQSTRLRTDVVLPQTKVKVIMKSSPEIDAIGADSVLLITKATVCPE